MQLENQCTSLQLSKELKEAGVPQESLFYWRLSYHISEQLEEGVVVKREGIFGDYRIEYYPKPRYSTADLKWNEMDLSKLDQTEVSAFTVAELGEMLPQTIRGNEMNFELNIWKDRGEWCVCYWWDEDTRRLSDMKFNIYQSKNLADAMAETLLYLLKEKLITLTTLNNK